MTQAAFDVAGLSPKQPPNPSAEFLWTGGATLLLFPVFWLMQSTFGLSRAELVVGFLTFHGAHLINDPHFSVTYLLFYKDFHQRAFGAAFTPAQRIRYWISGLLVPAALSCWAALAISSSSTWLMGALIQLMFLLVGWHYVKQGFGVLVVLSARRGAKFSRLERGVILGHCYAAWAYAWASPADPGRLVEEKGVVYTSMVHPASLEQLTQLMFFGSSLLMLGVLWRRFRRRELTPLAPVCGLLVSVWLWTVYSDLDPLMVYAIPALHSLQYIYFVYLLKRNEALANQGAGDFARGVSRELVKTAAFAVGLGWVLFHAAPNLLDDVIAPSFTDAPLGPTPYFAALFAIVNIHHYFMDFVIWRRENPDTRYLRDLSPS